MALPIRTTLQDIKSLCGYLISKPTGATTVEAKTVVDSKVLDGRKINAMKFWGLIEEDGNKLKISNRGRAAIKEKGVNFAESLREIISEKAPYRAMIERAVHKGEFTITATDVAAHWYEHFREESSDSDKILNDQANCYFQIAEGADLGKLIVGRKGGLTRFEFDQSNCSALIEGGAFKTADVEDASNSTSKPENNLENESSIDNESTSPNSKTKSSKVTSNKFFNR
jgi:hypothetical protein